MPTNWLAKYVRSSKSDSTDKLRKPEKDYPSLIISSEIGFASKQESKGQDNSEMNQLFLLEVKKDVAVVSSTRQMLRGHSHWWLSVPDPLPESLTAFKSSSGSFERHLPKNCSATLKNALSKYEMPCSDNPSDFPDSRKWQRRDFDSPKILQVN